MGLGAVVRGAVWWDVVWRGGLVRDSLGMARWAGAWYVGLEFGGTHACEGHIHASRRTNMICDVWGVEWSGGEECGGRAGKPRSGRSVGSRSSHKN